MLHGAVDPAGLALQLANQFAEGYRLRRCAVTVGPAHLNGLEQQWAKLDSRTPATRMQEQLDSILALVLPRASVPPKLAAQSGRVLVAMHLLAHSPVGR